MPSPNERLTFNEVSQILKNEEKSSDLTEVRKDFYPALRDYVRRIKADGDEEMRRDPYSVKANSLTNEIKKATQKASIIFEKRMRKILLMALRTAYGGKVDLARLTDEEKQCFDAVVDEVRACKSSAMEGQVMATRHSTVVSQCAMPSPMREAMEQTRTDENVPNSTDGEPGQLGPMVMIRLLEDIPQFKGTNRQFKLSKEDVVFLPASFGCALVRTGKAVEIEQGKR